jgi:hypothetical protein
MGRKEYKKRLLLVPPLFFAAPVEEPNQNSLMVLPEATGELLAAMDIADPSNYSDPYNDSLVVFCGLSQIAFQIDYLHSFLLLYSGYCCFCSSFFSGDLDDCLKMMNKDNISRFFKTDDVEETNKSISSKLQKHEFS